MKTKIVNHAPRRAVPSSVRSFNRVAGVLDFEPDNDNRAHWNKYIPLTPYQAVKMLTRDMPEGTTVSFRLEEDGTGEIDLEGPGIESANIEFDIKNKTLSICLMEVDDEYQGQGLGRTIVRNYMEFCHACGVETVDIHAGLTAGGYSWARFGYKLSSTDDDEIGTWLKEPVLERLKAFKPLLTKEERKALEKAAQFNSKKDLYKLAHANIDVAPRLRDVFNKAAANNAPKAEREKNAHLLDRIREALSDEQAAYLDQQLESGGKINIGRLLLAGTNWDGEIDMKSIKQMRHIGKYTGGWKYIRFEAA